uniref:Uncharacterized protein n=1 Tax=Rhizophora mucronata TaxID=61149 RepID=A0A2P2IP96_RHIMU
MKKNKNSSVLEILLLNRVYFAVSLLSASLLSLSELHGIRKSCGFLPKPGYLQSFHLVKMVSDARLDVKSQVDEKMI